MFNIMPHSSHWFQVPDQETVCHIQERGGDGSKSCRQPGSPPINCLKESPCIHNMKVRQQWCDFVFKCLAGAVERERKAGARQQTHQGSMCSLLFSGTLRSAVSWLQHLCLLSSWAQSNNGAHPIAAPNTGSSSQHQ